jgi:hypothetical protein
MKKCAFTAVDDRLYYSEGTPLFINSFKKFHPDIDLIVFRQDTIDKLFKEKDINWYMAKPYFAELLEDKYDLIVNMDADHIILDRMTEVFDKVDYEVALPWNYNDYENASFENITEKMYVQCGMVASTQKGFWEVWRDRNKRAMEYLRKENDIVNLVVYDKAYDFKLKILDKKKDYYGCKSLGREPEFYIKKGKTMCRKQQVVAYHFARGPVFPKNDILTMPITDEVKTNWLQLHYGQTVTIK